MRHAQRLSCVAVLTAFVALPVASQDTRSQERKENPPPLGTAAFIPPDSKKREPLTPENFVVRAAIANLSEIELSELALKKSADASIRKFATQIIQDHKAAQARLKSVAGAAKIALPGTVDEDHRQQKQALAERVGVEFDREYVSLMQSGHDQAIDLMSSAVKSQELEASLKNYANETLKIVQQHRDRINALHTQAHPR
jgi:putative membrane protein